MPSPHLHIVPQNDQIEHRVDDDGECVCGPRPEYVDTPDVTGWLVVHNSLDGREKVEQLVDLIEKNMADAIERATADLSDALGIPDATAEMRATLTPYIRPYAEAFAASLAAGETAEQLEERLAVLKIEES